MRKRSTDALRSVIGSELPPTRSTVGRGRVAQMYSDWFYSFIAGFVGGILFLLVDKYEPEASMARLLKLLILFVAGRRGNPAQIASLRFCAVLAKAKGLSPSLNPTKLSIQPSLRPTILSSDGLWEGMPWTTTQSL
jgi:hypothetical protein